MSRQGGNDLKQILVASDSQEALIGGVEKAATIEHYTGAAVKALLVSYDAVTEILVSRYSRDVAQQIIDDLLRNDRASLDAVLQPCREHIAELESDVAFERDTATAICAAARGRGADLIVKPLARSAHRADFLHAPLDWQLMREAPCPVLFTRTNAWQKPIRVLAALDVMDAAHTQLNTLILRNGALMAGVLGGEFHVATSYPGLAPYVTQYQVARDLSAIQVQLHDMRRDALARLLRETGVTATATYVEEGRPRDVIRALATTIGAGLTVVGTAGRSGLKKLLIGNTAEQIISDLPTDLLTVREAA